MAALPFVMVLLNFIAFSQTLTIVLNVLSFTLLAWRPYRLAKYNYFHAVVYFLGSLGLFTVDIPEVQNNHASKFLLAWGFLLNRMKGIFVFALTLSVLLYWAYHAIVAVKKRFNKKLKFSTKLKSLITKSTMEQDPLLEH